MPRARGPRSASPRTKPLTATKVKGRQQRVVVPANFRDLLCATLKIQRWWRKKRWFTLMGKGVPIVRGWCGYAILPIYNPSLELQGVEGVRQYRSTSMGCLFGDSKLRLAAIAIIEWPWFERLTLAVVILNCVDLAMLGPPDRPHAGYHDLIEDGATLYFTVELFLKVVAMGLIGHEDAYLADYWNQLDFVVVLTSWLPLLFPSLDNLSGMRAVRALRPLRAVNRLPELKQEVETLLVSLPQLADVAQLSAFIMVVFGVLGVQMFAGTLHYRCYEVGATRPIDASGDSRVGVCSLGDTEAVQGTCLAGQECRSYGANPLAGTVSFDSIGSACMTIFQIVTLEGWTDIMYMLERSSGPLACVYCVMIVVFGSFYVLNLFLAVMWAVNNPPPPRQPKSKKRKKPEAEVVRLLGKQYLPLSVQAAAAAASKEAAAVAFHLPSQTVLVAAANSPFGSAPPSTLRTASPLERFVNSGGFQKFILALIIASCLLLSMEHYPMTPEETEFFAEANVVMTLLFSLEMVLKHCALGCGGYWSDAFNRFDGVIVTISLVDIVAEFYWSELIVFRAFRLFRVFRIFRLVRVWVSLRELLAALYNSLVQLFYLMILLALFIFIFALLGMQLFGDQFTAPKFAEPPRANFDSITFSMITVFIVANLEDWNTVRRNTERAVGVVSVPFFVALIVLLNFIMLNLVVATLIGTFDQQAAKARRKRLESEQEDIELLRAENEAADDAAAAFEAAESFYRYKGRRPSTLYKDNPEEEHSEEVLASASIPRAAATSPLPAAHATPPPSPPERPYVELIEDDALRDIEAGEGMVEDPSDYALGLFGPRHTVRRFACALVEFQIGNSGLSFDNIIISIIIASSIAMAFNSCDLDPTSELAARLYDIDVIAMGIFVMELAFKVLAYGFISTPRAYLQDPWNQLDFLVVTSGLLSLMSSSPATRMMRVLRVLRPLRLIARSKGMRTAIELLLRAMPRVIDVVAVYLIFLFVFSILGVQLFGGTFASCHTPTVCSLEGCKDSVLPLDRDACNMAEGATWRNPSSGNFDDTPSAMLLLFEMSTLEGWTAVMFGAIDVVAIGEAPVRDASVRNAIFFILWIILGSMLLLNLFVGVLVNVFNEIKQQEEEGGGEPGAPLMTDEQRQWTESMESALELKPLRVPPKPKNGLGACCYVLVRHKFFDACILVVILFNTVLMALDGYGVPPAEKHILELLNNACTCVFLIEAFCKIVALGCEYFSDGWNVFDFFVVLVSIADWLIHYIVTLYGSGETNPMLLRVLRIVRLTRILRTLRLVKSAQSLKLLLSMLLLSLPALSNILGIYLIMLSMYSLLGMQLFGNVSHGKYLDLDANFCTFGRAALTLFRCSTGESWNGLMHDMMVRPESGKCSDEESNCGSILAVPFFVSYIVLSTYIVLKMMIVLIIENYLRTLRRDRSAVKPEDSEIFMEAWSRFDPQASGLMPTKYLVDFVASLPPPLGLNPKSYPEGVLKRVHVQQYVFKLRVRPVTNEYGVPQVPFRQLLGCLVRDAYFDKGQRVRHVRSWMDILDQSELRESATGKRLISQMVESNVIDDPEERDRVHSRQTSRDPTPKNSRPSSSTSSSFKKPRTLAASPLQHGAFTGEIPIGVASAIAVIIKHLRLRRMHRTIVEAKKEAQSNKEAQSRAPCPIQTPGARAGGPAVAPTLRLRSPVSPGAQGTHGTPPLCAAGKKSLPAGHAVPATKNPGAIKSRPKVVSPSAALGAAVAHARTEPPADPTSKGMFSQLSARLSNSIFPPSAAALHPATGTAAVRPRPPRPRPPSIYE